MTEISPFLLALHALAAVVWVGGMFFAYMVLRPSVPAIEPPPERLKLWARVFSRFFKWVWLSIIALMLSGYWQVVFDFSGFENAGLHIHWMHGTGWLMSLIFFYLFFRPYAAYKTAVRTEDWAAAREQLEKIRRIVGINLILGLITVAMGSSGRLWTSFPGA